MTSESIVRVFLIEDNDADAVFVREALRAYRVEVVRVKSVGGARVKIADREFVPDVALVDVRLPDGSGWDLIPEIECPCVVFTSECLVRPDLSATEVLENSLANGADWVMDKADLTGTSGPEALIRAIGIASVRASRQRAADERMRVEIGRRLASINKSAEEVAQILGSKKESQQNEQ